MSEDFCPARIECRGVTYLCGRTRNHEGDHQSIGLDHPGNHEDYMMRWSEPVRFDPRALLP